MQKQACVHQWFNLMSEANKKLFAYIFHINFNLRDGDSQKTFHFRFSSTSQYIIKCKYNIIVHFKETL